MINKKQSKWLVALSMILALIGMFAFSVNSVEARDRGTPLNDLRKPISGVSEDSPFLIPKSLNSQTSNAYGVHVVTPGDHVYMEGHYTFVPRVTSKTVLTTGGGVGWRDLNWYTNDVSGQPGTTKYRSIHLARDGNANRKGSIWAKYSNVGVVDGQSIDLKITLMDWKKYYNNASWVSFRKDDIAVSSAAYESVDMKWEFLKTGTNTPVKVSGYFTFGDIDLNQGIRFDSTTSKKIDAIVLDNEVRDSGSYLWMRNDNGKVHIYDTATPSEMTAGVDQDLSDDSGDSRARFSMLYSNQSSLRFEWVTEYGRRANPYHRNRSRNVAYDGNGSGQAGSWAAGSYMFYELDKPILTWTPPPKKTGKVYPMKGYGDYTITHTVPQEPSSYSYTKYTIEDIVEEGLINPKFLSVKDQNGIDRSNWFTKSESSQKAVATATNDALSSSNFYGNTFTFTVRATIDYDIANKSNSDTFDFKNNVHVTSNKMGNKADTRVGVEKELITVDHINEDNGDLLARTSNKVLPNTPYSEEARFNGSAYGIGGKLQVDRVVVNGSNKGSKTSVSGKVPEEGLKVTFYYRSPFKINISHVDDDTGAELHHDINYDNSHFKGNRWTFYPGVTPGLPNGSNTFDQNGQNYPYIPVNDSRTGIVNFQRGANTNTNNTDYNYNIEFRYTKANVDVAIESVRILTEHQSHGLPIQMDFDLLSIDEDNWNGEPRWDTTNVRVQVIDKSNSNQIIYNKLHSARDLNDNTIGWKIPATHLSTGQVRDYVIKIISPNDKEVFIRPGEGSLETNGYVATEDVLRISSSDSNREINAEWVSMTERNMGEPDIILHKEGIQTTVDEPLPMPTGYGHGKINDIVTWTDLTSEYTPKVKGRVLADLELSDGDYTESNGIHVVPMKESRSETFADNHISTKFEFPQTYVTDRGEGEIIVTNDQPDGTVNGYKRLYIPIWIDELGEYSYTFESTEPIGQNHVKVELEQVVDVQSHMYAHSDSPTLKDDALLLQPTREGWFTNLFSRDPFETRKEYMWQASDFLYSGDTITGFSSDGITSYNAIPEGSARLEIPTKNPNTGETVTKIGADAFRGFNFIGDFIAPSIEEIGSYAFYDANFSGEFSAENLKTVGSYAFMYSQFKGTLNAEKLQSVERYGFYHSSFDGDLSFIDSIGTEAFYHSENE